MVDEPFEFVDVGATARAESYIVGSATGGPASAESNQLSQSSMLTRGVRVGPLVCRLTVVLQDEVVRGCLTVKGVRLLCSSE